MKPILFFLLLILALAFAACAPIPVTDVVASQASSTSTIQVAVLEWERTGGFAGFCDKVIVYPPDRADVTNCKGDVKTRVQLTETQSEQLDSWMKTLKMIDYTHTDPATADVMTISLFFAAGGAQQADEETIQLISQFASDLAAQAVFNLNRPPEVDEAEGALQLYLIGLSMGDYIQGAKLYGGDTELLQTWNPDITNDLPKLFERACTQNGLVCMAPRSVTYRGLDADGIYQFQVEFNNPDGTLFVQGPCCGETEGPTFSSFLFRVRKTESGFAVLDLPPYVP